MLSTPSPACQMAKAEEAQPHTSLRRAGSHGALPSKGLSMPGSGNGVPSSAKQNETPIDAAQALILKHIGPDSPYSTCTSTTNTLAKREHVEDAQRRRAFRDKLEAEEADLKHFQKSLREQMRTPLQTCSSATDDNEIWKEAVELSLHGVHSLLHSGKYQRMAIALPATPEIVVDGVNGERAYAKYNHAVKVCAWGDSC